MPQIIKKSSSNYFMTIKLSWNDSNKFLYHTFNWKGIDGSKEYYKEEAIIQKILNLFGVINDGGPAASHLERIKRNNYSI